MKGMTKTKKYVGIAVFSALSYVISFLEFPIFPTAPFLKLDFSSVFILLSGFTFGPIGGICSLVVKEGLCALTKSSTGGVGELANLIVTLSFILLPTILYRYKKGLKLVIVTLSCSCVVEIAFSLLANRFVNFPLYLGDKAEQLFVSTWWIIILFNLIKTVSVSILTLILYKRISGFIKAIDLSKKTRYNENVFISKSERQTVKFAFEYAKTLSRGDVVVLEGDLGAGKTAFIKGVAEYFGLNGVTSPTYSYLNVYGDMIYHYDCYRLSCGEDAERLGLTDYFNGDNICLIEWAENIKDVLPNNVKKVKIEKISDKKRKITV